MTVSLYNVFCGVSRILFRGGGGGRERVGGFMRLGKKYKRETVGVIFLMRSRKKNIVENTVVTRSGKVSLRFEFSFTFQKESKRLGVIGFCVLFYLFQIKTT